MSQQRTTPCSGCDNSHPAYHHLHRVHPAHRMACNADQCSQGRKPCPTPQACEVAQDLADKPATTLEIVGYIGLLAAAVAAAIVLVILAAGA